MTFNLYYYNYYYLLLLPHVCYKRFSFRQLSVVLDKWTWPRRFVVLASTSDLQNPVAIFNFLKKCAVMDTLFQDLPDTHCYVRWQVSSRKCYLLLHHIIHDCVDGFLSKNYLSTADYVTVILH